MILKSLRVSTTSTISARIPNCNGQHGSDANKHAPVGEERPATQEDVWLVPSETLESFQQRSVDTPCAELVDELVVIDRQLLPVARDGALYVPRRHDLFVRRRGIRRLDCGCRGGGAPAG